MDTLTWKVDGQIQEFSIYLRKILAITISIYLALIATSTCRADLIDQQAGDELSLSSQTDESMILESPSKRLQTEALSLTGVRYRYGGGTPQTGFDCSGFVRYVLYHATRVSVGRTATSMAAKGRQVRRVELRVGDLVFFNTLGMTYSHVGIYLGGGHFIHSPSRGGRVRVEDLDDAYWKAHYSGARRLVI